MDLLSFCLAIGIFFAVPVILEEQNSGGFQWGGKIALQELLDHYDHQIYNITSDLTRAVHTIKDVSATAIGAKMAAAEANSAANSAAALITGMKATMETQVVPALETLADSNSRLLSANRIFRKNFLSVNSTLEILKKRMSGFRARTTAPPAILRIPAIV